MCSLLDIADFLIFVLTMILYLCIKISYGIIFCIECILSNKKYVMAFALTLLIMVTFPIWGSTPWGFKIYRILFWV